MNEDDRPIADGATLDEKFGTVPVWPQDNPVVADHTYPDYSIVFCPGEPESQGIHTYPASNGKIERGYVWCAHGAWSSPKLAKRMHEVKPDMPRGHFGPSGGRA